MKRWLSAWEFYELPRRKYGFERAGAAAISSSGASGDTHDEVWWVKDGEMVSSSTLATRYLNESHALFLASGGNFSVLASEPSQWAFNGMSIELGADVYGGDVARLARHVRDGTWGAAGDGSGGAPEGAGGGGGLGFLRGDDWAKGGDCEGGCKCRKCGCGLAMVMERFDESMLLLGKVSQTIEGSTTPP